MQHSIPDLLRPSLVPELASNIATSPAGNIHLALVGIPTLRALPHQLIALFDDLDFAIPATDLTIVAFGIEFCIDDVLIDKLDDTKNSGEVVLHIGDFDIADGTTGRERLKFGLELELVESVDFLRDMNMVAIGDVVLVGDARDNAKASLKGLCELVGGRFQRSAIQAEIDVAGSLPSLTGIVEPCHDLQRKRLGLWISVAFTGHILDALI